MKLAAARLAIDGAHGHVPVLLSEVVELLVVQPGGAYVDGTLGAGGHAAAILRAAGPQARLLGMDVDPLALDLARRNLAEFAERVVLVHGNFRHLEGIARQEGFVPANAVLLDLGLSSMQLADEARGFSFRGQGPLDMRFDTTRGTTAARILNQVSEKEIADLLWRFGEEPFSRRIARQVRRGRPVDAAEDLAEAVRRAVPPAKLNDSLQRTFQALRIAVNEELEALPEALEQAVAVLGSGGRIGVISFHSLEDRIVKRFIRRESSACLCPPGLPRCVCGHSPRLKAVTHRPVTSSAAELERNSRSRSAKLRAAEKL